MICGSNRDVVYMIDHCFNCFRLENRQKIICPECGSSNAVACYDGPTLVQECPDCGWGLTGASFFAPCELDTEHQYQIKVCRQELTREDLMLIRKLSGVSILAVKDCLEHDRVIPVKYPLCKVIKMYRALTERNIDFEILPGFPYSRIDNCKKRLDIRQGAE